MDKMIINNKNYDTEFYIAKLQVESVINQSVTLAIMEIQRRSHIARVFTNYKLLKDVNDI
jgi:hypothetical protein